MNTATGSIVASSAPFRLLVRSRTSTKLGLGASDLSIGGFQFRTEPLFQRAGAEPAAALAIGAQPSPQWLLATSAAPPGDINAWDLAHQVASQPGMGLAAFDSDAYAEPDFLQTAFYDYSHAATVTGSALAAAAPACFFNGDDTAHWPHPPEFAWHLGSAFSQLKDARDFVGDVQPGQRRIRIGHLDTGYDENHHARPEHILTALERSFIDGGPANRALDPGISGAMNNPGHGTGTIGLLAGGRLSGMQQAEQNTHDFLGGNPYAEILPVRVANSVVHFYNSGLARGLDYIIAPGGNAAERCDVVSLSMGGLPSHAWAEAVNRAYEAGIVIVAAAGNNLGRLTPTGIVWPARFRRVIAATGITGGYGPYKLDGLNNVMQGNFGPASKMPTALAGYTPNTSWAKRGCGDLIDRNGAGTSSATPQVAAAAALWLQKHRPDFPGEPWKKVEAVRRALFSSAKKDGLAQLEEFFGQGAVQARAALDLGAASDLTQTPPDSVSFPILSILTGLGIAPRRQTQMFELEALQLAHRSSALQEILPDPDLPPALLPKETLRKYVDAMIGLPEASNALKGFLKTQRGYVGPTPNKTGRGGQTGGAPLPPSPRADVSRAVSLAGVGEASLRKSRRKQGSRPPYRRLRGYAFDPSLSTRLDMAVVNQCTYQVPWEEDLQAGPVGEYVEVVDCDPASGCFYAPVDLNDPELLATDGVAPSEGNPQFHQQMVYAVAMTTIRNFEQALGRRALWASHVVEDAEKKLREYYVQRLRIYPHALREANAYYSPVKKALLFGYFPADDSAPGKHYPGGTVFACLSHDVVAHETTHALLDGMHQRYIEPTNPDVPAFHEAFADIVALLQHFSFPNVLSQQIAQTRGDLRQQNLLGQLAQQFGQAIGHYSTLRDAIGETNDRTGEWKACVPDPQDYQTVFEPHARGAILVAAIFDAFLSIYKTRVADLLRIASNGTGLLTPGELHPDLVKRLSAEAAKSARHVLRMCIRALDYCPPVDLTFGDYLRALITSDYDLVTDDNLGYRIAVVEAFRRRGIYPRDLRTLSVNTLRWDPVMVELKNDGEMTKVLKEFLQAYADTSQRRDLFNVMRYYRYKLHEEIHYVEKEVLTNLGFDRDFDLESKFEVHSLRPAQRTGPDGSTSQQIVIEITQQRMVYPEGAVADGQSAPSVKFRGGCTLIVDILHDPDEPVGTDAEEHEQASASPPKPTPKLRLRLRHCIRKSIFSQGRLKRQLAYMQNSLSAGLRATYFGEHVEEPFALLHRGGGVGDGA